MIRAEVLRQIFPYVRQAFLLIGVGVYIASLWFPLFPGWPGWGALLLGWLEILAWRDVGPFVATAWLANPLLFVAWWYGRSIAPRIARVSACLALIFALSYVQFGVTVVTDEAGQGGESPGWSTAFRLWISSMAITLIWTLMPTERREPTEVPRD